MTPDPHRAQRQRALLAVISVAAAVLLYTAVSNAYRVVDLWHVPAPIGRMLRPDIVPPTQDLVDTFIQLVQGRAAPIGSLRHVSLHIETLVEDQVTLQGSVLVSMLRVLIGLGVGVPLGILAGLAMGWSRVVDDYVHPLYIVLRSIPPLALISYAMLWLGHGEAHLLLPLVYAVFATMVIPTYHGVRDLAGVYVMAARTLGAGGGLLVRRVVLPAVGPSVLAGLRYALVIAWMTTVGVEMLMAGRGIGALLVGGGMWSSRLEVGVDPAVVVVGILSLAAAGYATDAVIRLAARLTAATAWVK